ncbi:DUF1365 family protein [Pseudoduganella eburnea]|uniref:DUF1365 family protein n=1 Tax=Massilia eburnea TaxID=1776165 RepID=A0A6L6QG06_9BURK|nr:DUF1365 domain-containing protein [Massilia eburnea]MTW11149.1 DUF1365 family protein [Massilia eburnea]
MIAQLIRGHVMHERLRPRRHKFTYPVFFVRLNLARLEEANTRWFGVNRKRLVSVRTGDYGPRDESNLEEWMRALLRSHAIAADGDIWLQTFPRILGYVFNPVSFFHCHDAQGNLRAVLAEVNNTFGGHQSYLLRIDANTGQAACAKELHVSPFCRIEGEYRFRFHIDSTAQQTRIDYCDTDGLVLKTAVAGKTAALGDAELLKALASQPLQCIGIIARIHWQALRLWLKGVPFHGKNPPASKRTLTEDLL